MTTLRTLLTTYGETPAKALAQKDFITALQQFAADVGFSPWIVGFELLYE